MWHKHFVTHRLAEPRDSLSARDLWRVIVYIVHHQIVNVCDVVSRNRCGGHGNNPCRVRRNVGGAANKSIRRDAHCGPQIMLFTVFQCVMLDAAICPKIRAPRRTSPTVWKVHQAYYVTSDAMRYASFWCGFRCGRLHYLGNNPKSHIYIKWEY